jgi:hypothetical protein
MLPAQGNMHERKREKDYALRARKLVFMSLFPSRSTEATFNSVCRILNGEPFSFLACAQDMDKFSSFAEDVTLARF